MPNVPKSVWAAGSVSAIVAAFLGGGWLREGRDLGSVRSQASLSVTGIVASTQRPQEVSEARFFYELMQLLEREYVDPITDERKLAVGSVRGMVSSLLDPYSQFMDPEQTAESERARRGEFGGIGIEVRFDFDPEELAKAQAKGRPADPLLLLPELVVAMVAPGSPAERAGMRVGDRIERVNDRWLLTSPAIRRLREVQKASADGKIDPAEAERVRTDFQAKARTTIGAGRARELLTTGRGQTVKVRWSRGGVAFEREFRTAVTAVPAVSPGPDGTWRLRVFTGSASQLKAALSGGKVKALDLRQSSLGDFEEVRGILALLAPAANYGTLASGRVGEPRTLTVAEGTDPRPWRVIVDESTRGAAEIVALALGSVPGVSVEGRTAGEPVWIERVRLEDGSSYTLATARFEPRGVQ